MANETTFGTGVTVTRFLEFNNETVAQTRERIESSGLRPNRRVVREKQWTTARLSSAGDVEFDVNTTGFGLLLKNMMGEQTWTQPNAGSFPTVYQGFATVGRIDGKSFTFQIARADDGGTIRAFTYAGGKVAKWELMNEENGFLKLKTTLDAVSETTATGLAAAAYSATAVPLSYTKGVVKVGGAEQPVKKITLVGDNKLKLDRYTLRGSSSQEKKEQLEGEGLRDYTGSITAEFTSLELYEKFTSGANAELEVEWAGANIAGTYNSGLLVKCPAVRFDGKTPNVPGPSLIEVDFPIKVVDSGAGNGPVQMTYTTTDTAE